MNLLFLFNHPPTALTDSPKVDVGAGLSSAGDKSEELARRHADHRSPRRGRFTERVRGRGRRSRRTAKHRDDTPMYADDWADSLLALRLAENADERRVLIAL